MDLSKYDFITIDSAEEGVKIAKIFKNKGMLINEKAINTYSYFYYPINTSIQEWFSFFHQRDSNTWCRSTASKERRSSKKKIY